MSLEVRRRRYGAVREKPWRRQAAEAAIKQGILANRAASAVGGFMKLITDMQERLDGFTLVRSYSTPLEADLDRMVLEEEGVEVRILDGETIAIEF